MLINVFRGVREVLVKLTKEQVTDYWEVIKPAIELSIPPTVKRTPDYMVNILWAILMEKIDCWVLLSKPDGGDMYVIGTTAITIDEATGQRNLLIYSLYGMVDNVPKDVWLEGFESLRKQAKAMKCASITGLTNVKRVKQLVTMLGGDASFNLVKMEV